MPNSVSSARTPEGRLEQIEAVTDTALAHLDVSKLLRELLQRVRDLLEVDTSMVLLHDEKSGDLIPTASVGFDDSTHRHLRVPHGRGFAGAIATRKQSVVVDEVDQAEELAEFNPALRERGIRSLLGVPMLAEGRVVGVLHVGSLTHRTFREQDTHLLQLVADRVALATQANASRTDRAAAGALQRSLLPARLPELPGITLDARYVPGEDAGVGGDWYDVFTLPSGHVGVVIGDVVGNGLSAAVVMGRMRSSLRAYALDNDSPSAVLEKLDRKMTHFEANAMATVCYAVVDPTTGGVRFSLAGHPAPVRASNGGAAAIVEAIPDPPVGFGLANHPRSSSHFTLPEGTAAVFYTDGLVENRHSTVDDGLERLCRETAVAPAKTMCEKLMTDLVGSAPVTDDIAFLALSRQG